MRLELHPEARAELRSAAVWYDERRPGLGDELIAEVSATLDRIGDAPESYPAWAAELERRSRDVAEGRVQTTSWDTARTEILKELEQRRASRTTS